MKIETKLNILQEIVNNRFYPQTWRFGQALFNIAYKLFPNETESLRGSNIDCFFVDDKAQRFIDALEKLVVDNKPEYILVSTNDRLPTIEDSYFIQYYAGNKDVAWFNPRLGIFQYSVPKSNDTISTLHFAGMLVDKDLIQFWLEPINNEI